MNSQPPLKSRHKIFVSYSHRDKNYLDRLRVHFAPMQREGSIEFWADTKIRPGKHWRKEIKKSLDESSVAILLISADFLGSDFIHEHELPQLLTAEVERGLTVLPVHLSASDYENTALARIQSVNDPAETVASMDQAQREEIFLKVVKEARRILEKALASFESTSKIHRANDQNLLEFPREILKKKNLTTLYLSGNRLRTLPDEFTLLSKLKVLYLNRNQFEEIPEVVYKLPRLKDLYFSDNQVRSLRSSIINLKNLEMLRLNGNQLDRIPSEIGSLTKLTELYLADNRLKSVPSELGNLTKLEQLDVTNNKIDKIPRELKKLRSLERFSINGNKLSQDEELKKWENDPGRIFEILFG